MTKKTATKTKSAKPAIDARPAAGIAVPGEAAATPKTAMVATSEPESTAETDVEKSIAEANQRIAEAARLRQGVAPACPICKVVCKSQKSNPYYTRYRCPTKGCSFAQNVPRPRIQDRVKQAEEAEVDFSARPKRAG